jgi:hypothetical protein
MIAANHSLAASAGRWQSSNQAGFIKENPFNFPFF